jgi:hypothetical protein
LDNEIATALLCARGDKPTIDGDDTATITTAYTDGTGDYDCDDFEDRGSKARRLTPAAGKRLETNLKKEQVKVTKLQGMIAKINLNISASKLSARNLKEKHTNALAKKDNGEYLIQSIVNNPSCNSTSLHLDFDKVKQRLQTEIGELSLAGNFGVVSGIFPPKTTDMPTCRHNAADTTQTMSATLHRVVSSDVMAVSCRLAYFDVSAPCRRYAARA